MGDRVTPIINTSYAVDTWRPICPPQAKKYMQVVSKTEKDNRMYEDLATSAYAVRRLPLIAGNGVAATSHPLAAQAGLAMLQRGGSAADAAIAMAAVLTVVEPTSNGIGGDAFALVWDGQRLHGLNGSGRAPATHTPALFRDLGRREVPALGWLPVTIPGAPAAWRDLHARFGKLAFERLFEPAIYYAEHGYPVAPGQQWPWDLAFRRYREVATGPEFRGWFETFAP